MHSTSSTEMMLAEGFLDHAAYDVESGIQPLITPSGVGAEIRWACDPSYTVAEMMLAEGFLDHAAYNVESGFQNLITPSGVGAEIRWAWDPSHNDMTIWRILHNYGHCLHTEFFQALCSVTSCILSCLQSIQ